MLEFTLPSSDGINTLACYKTECKNPRAMVQLSHGMCEYIGRYEEFAEFLSESGFLVFGHDHLGHGHTAATPDDLGFTVSGGGAKHLVDDLHHLTLLMKMEHPDLPLILFGHSMGSFVVRETLAIYGTDYAAAVICGTSGPDLPTGMGKLLSKLIMAFKGERHRSPLLKKISFAGYNKKFDKQETSVAWLTRDSEIRERYLADPFCNYVFTARAYHDLFTLIEWVSDGNWAERLPKELPILIISGANDPVGSYGKGVRKVANRLVSTGHHVTLRLYPEMRHEILNETEHEQVWKEIKRWMRAFQM
jgi:alpha-beta hydrolase superfamily lysophospholipase